MTKSIKAEEFDRIFDEGEEDIVDYLDLSTVRRPNLDTDLRRVNVDFPEWMIDELDREAKRVGINPPGGHQDLDRRAHRPHARLPLGVGRAVGTALDRGGFPLGARHCPREAGLLCWWLRSDREQYTMYTSMEALLCFSSTIPSKAPATAPSTA